MTIIDSAQPATTQPMHSPSTDIDQWLNADSRELARAMAVGCSIETSALRDRAYLGISLGLPGVIEKMTWKTFVKTFAAAQDGGLRGYNVRLVQHGVDGPVEPKQRRGRPVAFGHYRVRALDAEQPPRPCGPGLLIDYSRYASSLDPLATVRDPIVAVRKGDPSMLLGWSYLQVGSRTVSTPSYFLLLRRGSIVDVVGQETPEP